MLLLYTAICALVLTLTSLVFIKNLQLGNYKIKKYIENIFKFNFAVGNKNKLKFTKRAIRLIFVNFLINFSLFLIIFYLIENLLIKIIIIFAIFITSPYLFLTSVLLIQPCEIAIRHHYIKLAKNKLKMSSCKKIAITGSFGKTSTKNILYQLLRQEFDVCSTPKSFNTPMVICKTILQDLKETDDFFIVEMGARNVGEIKFLAKMVGVDFGIITPIGNCHLETFGSVEKIEDAKYELCENTTGPMIFNGKSKSTRKLFKRYPYKKYLVCTKGGFAYAEDIKCNENGSHFILVIDGKRFPCKTRLLGHSSIDNIVVGAAMAYILGETLLSIQKAIEKLEQTPHRLQLIRGFVNIIDDSYNSNLDGFQEALRTIQTFSGRKIVVSPGIVELGEKQSDTNIKVGKEVAKIADIFVIMNETNKTALYDGAKSGGMGKEQIFFAKTRQQQRDILKTILQKGDCVLFENDFPDNIK